MTPIVEVQQRVVQYSSVVKDSIYTLTYIYKHDQQKDTIIYVLKEGGGFINKLKENSTDEDKLFSLVNKTSVWIAGMSQIKKKEYKVYKYASNGANKDGCISHFWVPEFGIVLKRNTSRRTFQKLKTNNDSINKQLEILTDIIYQDQEFYRGCQFEIPDEEFELEREQMILEKRKGDPAKAKENTRVTEETKKY